MQPIGEEKIIIKKKLLIWPTQTLNGISQNHNTDAALISKIIFNK